MAEFITDLKDIYFGLFDVLKIQRHRPGAEATDYSDLKEILEQFNKYVASEIWPTRIAGDVEGVRMTKDGVKVPDCFHKANKGFYENGWFALGMPEEVQGMPVPHALNVACNALAVGANVGFSMYASLTKAALNVIIKIGTDKQKAQYCEKMMTGEWGGTMCLTEAGAGSDVGALSSTARPIGEGRYSIKGVKIFISSGESDLYSNNIHLVLARTPGAPEGTRGLSLFIVPRFDVRSGKSNNVICTKIEEKMGLHASATCELAFGRDGECIGELLGKEFDGMANMFLMMNEARLLCGLQGDAQANLAFLLSERYSRERVQFGKEISHHPDVKRLLLRMRSVSRGMRALNYYTSDLFDLAHNNAQVEDEIALLTPICKSYCSEQGFNVAVDAVQVHGGYGYCTEYGVEQFVRDIKIVTIYEGTNGIQAIDFLMRKILRDEAKAFKKLLEKMNKTFAHASLALKDKEEVALFGVVLEKTNSIIAQITNWAMAKKMDALLFKASDILEYCGHMAVAWQLLEHAVLAEEKLKTAEGADLEYYKSKIVDYRFFGQHFLTRNLGIAHNLLNFKDNIL